MADTKLLHQRVSLAAQSRINGCKQAACHAALMLLGCHNQVVAHRHLAEDLQCLEGAAYTTPAQLKWRQAGDVFSLQLNRATVRSDLAKNAVEQRGFAGAVGANHTKYFARHDIKRHTTHGLNGTVGFFQASDF